MPSEMIDALVAGLPEPGTEITRDRRDAFVRLFEVALVAEYTTVREVREVAAVISAPMTEPSQPPASHRVIAPAPPAPEPRKAPAPTRRSPALTAGATTKRTCMCHHEHGSMGRVPQPCPEPGCPCAKFRSVLDPSINPFAGVDGTTEARERMARA